MTFRYYLIIIFTILFFTSSFGQSTKKQKIINNALSTETIKNQLDALVINSPTFRNFKNLRNQNLNKFIKNFKDSLIAIDNKFNAAYLKINNQKIEIDKLNTMINSTNENLTKVSQEKSSIDLFGKQMSKSLYNTILWSIILGLLVCTLFFLFKYKSSHSITRHAKSSLLEIEEEFETHKKSSLEREQILRRKLQDEINKQRNTK